MKNTFDDIEFVEEGHAYFLGLAFIPSVSSKIAQFYKPFDPKIARYVAKSKGISEQEVKEDWRKTNKDAIALGKDTHDYAEKFVKNESTQLPFNKPQDAFVKWLSSLDPEVYEVVFVEKPIYSRKYWYAGTPDLILRNKKTNKYVIVDYKTNKDLFKNYKGQRLLYPFQEFLDMPLNKYKIQLAHYQIALEENEYEVEDRIIIWLNREGEFQQFFLEDFTQPLKDFYE